MLKVDNQVGFSLSNHAVLFELLIKKDNLWRQLNEMVDFSFVYEELKDKYSSTMGRKAEGVIEVKNKLIQDSTHTNARFQHISHREELIRQAKLLRKAVYKIDENMKDFMPKKREATGLLEDQIEYTKELLNVLKKDTRFTTLPDVKEQINMLEETMMDTEYEIEYSKDKDARVGHKTADTSFFGYKTHIAMTPERIITAATITTGEKHDGKELKSLVEKSQNNGIEVEAVIGDGAYSEINNIEYCDENDIKLASKLSKCVTHGRGENKEDFEYNKDAEMYVKLGIWLLKKLKLEVRKTKKDLINKLSHIFLM